MPTEWAPGHQKSTHRMETVGYIVILSGEIDLELDGNEAVHLKQGDILVQRGGMSYRDAQTLLHVIVTKDCVFFRYITNL
jgi:hypothetical protein